MTVAYVAAGVVAWIVARALPGAHPLWIAFAADVAATLVVFGFSVAFRNSSFYDPYWSVAPPILALYFVAVSKGGAPDALRQVVASLLVFAWAVRLTANWARGWSGLGHEDWRYAELEKKSGRAYWLVSLFGIHLFPTLQVFLGCLPLWPALVTGARPFGALDVAASVLALGGTTLELIADEQLRAFRRTARPGETMTRGLWAWSRHPNYFGEMTFWWGLALFGLAAAGLAAWWACAGAVAISAMFATASIPMLDRRMLERRPGYAEIMARISAVIPWPPKRREP